VVASTKQNNTSRLETELAVGKGKCGGLGLLDLGDLRADALGCLLVASGLAADDGDDCLGPLLGRETLLDVLGWHGGDKDNLVGVLVDGDEEGGRVGQALGRDSGQRLGIVADGDDLDIDGEVGVLLDNLLDLFGEL